MAINEQRTDQAAEQLSMMTPTLQQTENIVRGLGIRAAACGCDWESNGVYRAETGQICRRCLADAEDTWDIIAPMVLEAAAKLCDSFRDLFAGTEFGHGINKGASYCADRIRALKTP